MSIIAKAKVVEASKGGAVVQILDQKGKLTSEKRRVGVKEGLRLRKGDSVLISFGVAVEKMK